MNSLHKIIMDRQESLFRVGDVHIEVTPRGCIFIVLEDALLEAWGMPLYVRGQLGEADRGYLYWDGGGWYHGSSLTGRYPVDDSLQQAIGRYILEAHS